MGLPWLQQPMTTVVLASPPGPLLVDSDTDPLSGEIMDTVLEREVLSLSMDTVLLLDWRIGTMFMDMSLPLDMPSASLTLDFPPLTSSAPSFTLDTEREMLNLSTDMVLALLFILELPLLS